MSSENFDKKIRERLVNHIPKYDSGAWTSFQKLLPSPWYMKLIQNYGGWVFGGITSTALLVTLYSYNTKTELLREEISTLKEEIKNHELLNSETQILNKNRVDTVYINREIDKYIRLEMPQSSEELAYRTDQKKELLAASKEIAVLKSKIDKLDEKPAMNTLIAAKTDSPENYSSNGTTTNAELNRNSGLSSISPIDRNQDHEQTRESSKSASDAETSKLDEGETPPIENTVAPFVSQEVSMNQEAVNNSEQTQNIQKDLEKPSEPTALTDLPKTENEKLLAKEILDLETKLEKVTEQRDTERIDPAQSKKKLNIPRMRFGLASDYLGLKVFANGPSAEVFLSDKLSFGTGILFSGQIETKHPFARDFNKNTGKLFNEEFRPYVSQRLEQIENISIKTSLIKLPLYFSYYINTWSRFSFIVSAGTKLDLSVYQDIGYFSGPLGQQIRSRFEARPKPKTFNNFFYGMGLQYKYKSFVGQVTPYFDFAFRKPDYFSPGKNFGANASLKFEFGK